MKPAAAILVAGFLAAGLLVSAIVFLKVSIRKRPPMGPAPVAVAFPDRGDEDLRRENEVLKAEVARLKHELSREKEKSTPPPPAKDRVTPGAEAAKDDPPTGPEKRKEAFQELARQGFGAFSGQGIHRVAALFGAAGPEGIRELAEILLGAPESADRAIAAAILELGKDAGAIGPLSESLEKEKNELVRRMVSHALGVIGTPASVEPLRRAMRADADWGVRVNSSYGLAKQGDADGLEVLTGYYLSPDLAPEYRLPVLGGLADVAAPSTAPVFRKILRETTDMSYLLIAIGALEKMKDAGAMADLQALRVNPAVSEDVREAARKALDKIGK